MPDFYETEAQLNEYLVFHYATLEQTLPWDFGPPQAFGFHTRLANCVDSSQLPQEARALDLGCSVGRTSFELSRVCSTVIGVDYSNAFVKAANDVLNTGEIPLILKREGTLGDKVKNQLPNGVNRERVRFVHGNAEDLPDSIGTFDVIIFANVLDRLPHPQIALEKLTDICNPGAQLVICSPFTWWDEFTIPERRLGGFVRNGKEVTSHDTIASILEPHFRLKKTCDLPFLIREHERKYHFSVAQTGIWTRLDH